jgi:hypothetical protein
MATTKINGDIQTLVLKTFIQRCSGHFGHHQAIIAKASSNHVSASKKSVVQKRRAK